MPAHYQYRPDPNERTAHKDKLWELVYFVLQVSEAPGRLKLKEKFQIDIDQ